jgi:hypothetical protein
MEITLLIVVSVVWVSVPRQVLPQQFWTNFPTFEGRLRKKDERVFPCAFFCLMWWLRWYGDTPRGVFKFVQIEFKLSSKFRVVTING